MRKSFANDEIDQNLIVMRAARDLLSHGGFTRKIYKKFVLTLRCDSMKSGKKFGDSVAELGSSPKAKS